MKKGKGKVLWFNEYEGRGYILSDSSQKIYVHYSSIQSKSKFKKLKKDQDVEFVLHPGEDFLQTKEVRAV